MQVLHRRTADFPAHYPLASRFGDHDATGRTSDQALGRMAEQGRVNLLTALMGPERLASPVGFMVADVSLRWLRRGRAPAAWNVGSGVLRSGDRSITIRAQLSDGDDCHAACDSVMVAIDRSKAFACLTTCAPRWIGCRCGDGLSAQSRPRRRRLTTDPVLAGRLPVRRKISIHRQAPSATRSP